MVDGVALGFIDGPIEGISLPIKTGSDETVKLQSGEVSDGSAHSQIGTSASKLQ